MAVILRGSPRRTMTDCLVVFHGSWLATFPWERWGGSPSTSPFQMGPPHAAVLETEGSECELPDAQTDFAPGFAGFLARRHSSCSRVLVGAQTCRMLSADPPDFYCVEEHSLLCLNPFPSTSQALGGSPWM